MVSIVYIVYIPLCDLGRRQTKRGLFLRFLAGEGPCFGVAGLRPMPSAPACSVFKALPPSASVAHCLVSCLLCLFKIS